MRFDAVDLWLFMVGLFLTIRRPQLTLNIDPEDPLKDLYDVDDGKLLIPFVCLART